MEYYKFFGCRIASKQINYQQLSNYRVFIAKCYKVNAFFGQKNLFLKPKIYFFLKMVVGHLWISENIFIKIKFYVWKSLVL